MNTVVQTSERSNIITNKEERSTWREITEAMNDCSDSGSLCSENNALKKWKGPLSKAKKKKCFYEKNPSNHRGFFSVSIKTIIVDVLGEDFNAVTGLVGVEIGKVIVTVDQRQCQ